MIDIECAGERLQLLAEKAVFWPRQKTLIVADIHFGKPAAFRQAGVPVPESTTGEDLARLHKIIIQTQANRLVILGDLFHARAGLQPEMLDAVFVWREQNARLEIVLVDGNHDKKAGAPPSVWGVQTKGDCWKCAPFQFCHDPKHAGRGYWMAGHIHPGISLRERFGSSLRVPCFCFGKSRAILPAFGSFTGLATIKPEPGERIFAINPRENEILEVPR